MLKALVLRKIITSRSQANTVEKPKLCLCHIGLRPVADSCDHGNESHLHERRVFY